jgi:hypothetical protein
VERNIEILKAVKKKEKVKHSDFIVGLYRPM